MKILVKNGQERQRTSLLKKSSSGGRGTDLIFTYAVKSKLPTVTLLQQETGISLILEMEKLEDTLRVTRFTLVDRPQLGMASEDFYEAAWLEIVLQALTRLFFYAQRYEMEEVLFILPQDEAAHISDFEGLFEEISPLTLGDEQCLSLTLSCASEDYFFEQISSIKAKINHELWKAQREDLYLRNYLQNHPKGEPLLFEETTPQAVRDNVILFPHHFQQ